jgi:serine/threonine-protein kinase
LIGNRLNHYEIVRKLGSGGMGDVYAARDGKLGREVALKILPPQMAGDEGRLERFRREATAVAALDHPNIVTIFSIEQAVPTLPHEEHAVGAAPGHGNDAVHFLTMQLVEGKTLDELIPRRGLALDRFFALAIPLADAVASAHEKGITHRDLKPTNVMVTPEGRVKILDFGLAKLVDPRADEDAAGDVAATEAATMAPGSITEEGKILGTAAYMSPEQAEGRAIDHRTDIFSLGIILYEMATGEAPFHGDSRVSILSSVVNDRPAPVSDVNRTAPRHLGRIIDHSLEKDPQRRFQSALDLRNELEALKTEMDSGEILAASMPARSGMRGAAGPGSGVSPVTIGLAAAAIVATLGAAWYWLGADTAGDPVDPPGVAATRPGVAVTPVATADDRPSVAVLYFDNTSGDEDLDWLRTGLPEMLVTDLSQSRGIRVLPTDRLYGILADAGVLDAGASEALDAVADSLGVDRVLVGSVLRSGARIRIVARLQDLGSGEIVASETLEGDSEEELFELVDRLTRSVRATFTGLATGDDVVDRDVTEVTTSSIEALRAWVEANRYMDLVEYDAARERLQRAVEIDPEFAMAYAKMAAIEGNLGNVDLSREHAQAALRHADHLTDRERYYVEGTYYYGSFDQTERAAEAFANLLEFDPSSTAARNNLALALQRLDRHEEAIAHLEILVDNDVEFVGSWTNLADAYADQGRFEDAEAVMLRLAERRPESGAPYSALAGLYVRQGRLDEALEATEEALRRQFWFAYQWRAAVGIIRRDWPMVEEVIAAIEEAPNPVTRRVTAPQGRADLELYRGNSGAALEVLAEALAAVPEPGTFTSWLHDGVAYVHEARGELDAAITAIERAVDDAPGSESLQWQLPLLGRLQAMAGRVQAAHATAARYDTLTAAWPRALVAQETRILDAAITRAAGDPAGAVARLEEAAAELTPSGADDPWHPYVWFDLANAHIAAGNPSAAIEVLQRLVESFSERWETPYEYVYSLYLLGSLHAERGEVAAARARYELFLEHWDSGDLRRDEVEAARAWLAAH